MRPQTICGQHRGGMIEMCRIYKDYVRACAATGHRGEKVPKEAAVWNQRHDHILFGEKGKPKTYVLAGSATAKALEDDFGFDFGDD